MGDIARRALVTGALATLVPGAAGAGLGSPTTGPRAPLLKYTRTISHA